MINIYCCEDNEMERKELKSVIKDDDYLVVDAKGWSFV